MVLPDIEGIRKASRDADREDKRRAELFRPMIQSEGWKEYVKLIESRIQSFSDELLAPARGLDGMVASEWIKGAMSGLIIARDIASATIGAAEELRRVGLQAEDDSDE